MPSSTETMTMRDVAIERLAWVRQFTEGLLAPLSGDQWIARAGGVGNSPIWVVGHIAYTEDQFMPAIGLARLLGEDHDALFGYNTEPKPSLSDYPPVDELLGRMRATRETLVEWVRGLDDETARQPLPEELQPFAPDFMSLPIGIAAHEMFHAGQLSTVRSSLGIPRMF